MKKVYLCSVILLVIISGCFKDDCKSVHRLYKPIFKSLSAVRADMVGGAAQPIYATGKIYLYNNYILINEPGKGIHVIDNSKPSSPQNISFINIPGNYDLAVKDNYLYADSYSDLVVFDIADAKHAVAKEFKNDIFPNQNRYYYSPSQNPDSIMVVVDYKEVDTTVDCNSFDNLVMDNCANCSVFPGALYSSVPTSSAGPNIGGSTARFTILNNFLYTIDFYSIYAFNLSNSANPELADTTNIGSFIETIFPFENKLFIGSPTGMLVYDATNAARPQFAGQFSHFVACDPVIADGKNAFVTIRNGSECRASTSINELDILDITSDITNPTLLKTYALTNPRGLSKNNNLLFICDGSDGLKIYDATDVNNLVLKQQLKDAETNDVITYNDIAYVIATDGLYEYNFSNANDIKLISKINIQ